MKEISKEQMEKLSDNFASINNQTKELTNSLKKFVVSMAESHKKMNLVKLKNKECLQQMWFEKLLKSKCYNRWYYKMRFKLATKEYYLCAGMQYVLEKDFEVLMETLDDIGKKNEENN